MPLAVNQAVSAYDGKKDSLVQEELDKLRDATHNINEWVGHEMKTGKGSTKLNA